MTRDELLEHVRPLVEDLAGELATMLFARLETQLAQALDAARSALESDLLPLSDGAARVDDHTTSEVSPHSRSVASSDNLSRPSGRKPNTCKACGAVGFTARTCGKTHNISTAVEEITPVVHRDVRPAINIDLDDDQAEDEPERLPPPYFSRRPLRRDHRCSRGPQARRRAAGAAVHLFN